MTADGVRQFLRVDLERRIALLPDEVEAIRRAAENNAAGLGIHTSQLTALDAMIDELAAGHRTALGGLDTPVAAVFADRCEALLEQLNGAHDVWRIFRIIFHQRHDARMRPLADAADLVAASAYMPVVKRAKDWGVLQIDQDREPPLTYLESAIAPATASRGENVELLGFPVRAYRNMMLPVPIVLFPVDQASSMWTMCSIAHEVGHNLDHDLDPRPNKRLTDEHRKLLIGRVPNDREPQWRRWTNEIFADAVAVLLCGPGFAHSMTPWIVPLAQGAAFQELVPTAVHPPLHLRLRLLVELLRATGIETFRPHTGTLFALWEAMPRPAWQAPYEADTPTIAAMFLQEKLPPLGESRTLLHVGSGAAFAHRQAEQLATYWADDHKPRPDPKAPYAFHLVPAAAALAAAALDAADLAALTSLHAKATAYFKEIPVPGKLAGPPGRREYVRTLARRLDFTRRSSTRE